MPAPQTITIAFSGRDLQTLYLALDELPGKISRQLYQRIEREVGAALQAANEEDEKNAKRAAKAMQLLADHEKAPPSPEAPPT